MTCFVEELKFRLAASGYAHLNGVSHPDILGHHGEILPSIVERCGLPPLFYYPVPAGLDVFDKTVIIEKSKNQWASTRLPQPFNLRMHRLDRPGLDMFKGAGGKLFVSKYGYQYFDTKQAVYWPQASSRTYGFSVLDYPARDIESSVVIIQDQFDSTNFAHFLYDYIPRIIYFCELGQENLSNVKFLMGGTRKAYHSLILRVLEEKYHLSEDQFHFTDTKEIWTLKGNIYFFSDQSIEIAHPLNICSPQTLRLIQSVFKFLHIPNSDVRKLYISRGDAAMRRLRNEAAVTDTLKRNGYSVVSMSEYDPLTQISLLAGAESIVAPHGMGLTNILFNTKICRLTELFNPKIGADDYALVATSTGIDYRFIVGDESEKSNTLDYDVGIDILMNSLQSK